MSVALVFIFYCPYEITIEDDDECKAHHCPLQLKKKNLDVDFSWVAGDDDEPLGSSSSFKQILCTQNE
jgi:hypothetical protein